MSKNADVQCFYIRRAVGRKKRGAGGWFEKIVTHICIVYDMYCLNEFSQRSASVIHDTWKLLKSIIFISP
jgi:hypothetical protein